MFTKTSAEALLALGGAIIFLSFGVWFLILSSHTQQGVPLPQEKADVLTDKSDFELGQYYFNHDDSPEGPYDLSLAQMYFEKEIAENPTGNPLLWYQSGRIDFINGDFDRALEKFDMQIEYFGDDVPNVYYMIGLTYGFKARATHSDEDWKRAEEAFKTFMEYYPEAAWPRIDLAWVYFSQGKFQEMKPLLEEGIWYEANNPWLLNMYGLALFNTGDKEMAREYFIFARELADELTVEEWGLSYPGNDPDMWDEGLSEFRSTIERNIALVN